MRLISPYQLARAAGVSESSIKRWCDQGQIPSIKTAGGHRRFALADAADFLRKTNRLAFPELLGLPVRKKQQGDFKLEFQQSVIEGNERACRQIVIDQYMAGESVSKICDQLIAATFRSIGDQWSCGEVAVYQERRACEICMRSLQELISLVPVNKKGPAAVGATYSGDPYVLPNLMVEAVLRQNGWRSQSLGTQLPFDSLIKAVRDLRPQLFWLSVSSLSDPESFLAGYGELYRQCHHNTAIVVGGRALDESLRCQMQYSAFCDNMQHLEAFVASLKKTKRKKA